MLVVIHMTVIEKSRLFLFMYFFLNIIFARFKEKLLLGTNIIGLLKEINILGLQLLSHNNNAFI